MFRTIRITRALASLLALTALVGCGDPALDDGAGRLSEPACVALADSLMQGDDWRAGLVPLDPAPRPSVARPDATIRLWVSADAIDAYRALAVDAEAPGAGFPRGGVVVREMFDAAGERTAITATCRAQAGYNPEASDLWFGKRPGTLPTGASDGIDGIETGVIPSCNGCHTYNDATDGLYGPLMPSE